MKLNCGDCGTEMTRFQPGLAWVWRCGSCNAHALTASSLRKVVPGPVWAAVWPVIRAAAVRGDRTCPMCARSLDLTPPLDEAAGLRVDVCDPCQLIWLDPSEFDSLPKRPVPFELPPELAREMALAEVELMNLEYDEREAKISDLVKRLFDGIVQGLAAFGAARRR